MSLKLRFLTYIFKMTMPKAGMAFLIVQKYTIVQFRSLICCWCKQSQDSLK